MQIFDKTLLTGSSYAEHRKYWNTFFPDFHEGRAFLQKDGSNDKGIKSSILKECTIELSTANTTRLLETSGDTDAGTFVLLVSAFAILIRKYSRQASFILDTPLYASSPYVTEHELRVPLCLYFNDNQSYREFLNDVQSTVKSSYAYQNFPLQLLAESNVLNVFKTNILLKFGSIHVSNHSKTQYDLIADIVKTDNRFSLKISYDSNKFDDFFIANIAGHYNKVLSYLDEKDVLLKDISILTEEEFKKFTHSLNCFHSEYKSDQTIVTIYDEIVKKHAHEVAVVLDNSSLTYLQLDEQVNALAYYLRSQCNIQNNDIVAIIASRSIHTIVAIMGVLKAGGSYLPIEPGYAKDRVYYILQDSQTKVLLLESEFLMSVEAFKGELFAVDVQLAGLEKSPENFNSEGKADDLAYVIYTSGTSGLPKGAMVSHKGIVNLVHDQINRLGITSNDKFLQFASFSFDASVLQVFSALLTGGTLVLAGEHLIQDPEKLYAYCEQQGITIAALSASYLTILNPARLHTLRVLTTGGETPNKAKALLCASLFDYYNAYGPTECTVNVTMYKVSLEDSHRERIPIGSAISNVGIYNLDENLCPVPVGIKGELYVSGAGIALGYLHQPTLTAERFVNNPFQNDSKLYKTGDIGRMLPDGNLEFLGRIDNQVKIRGYRIELEEIENIALKHKLVDHVIVIARERGNDDKFLVLYYVSKNNLKESDLRNYLIEHLPLHCLPSYFILLENLPLTINGKTDYTKLSEIPLEETQTDKVHVEPRNKLEKDLVFFWQEILKTTRLGITDDFFISGGDSIKAIRLVSRINSSLNITVEIKDLFNHSTIASLSEYLSIENNHHQRNEALECAMKQIEEIKVAVLKEMDSHMPEEWEDFYPMSDICLGMIFYNLFNENAGVYHDQIYFQIEDPSFDFDRIKQALTILIDKHGILRTSFHVNEFTHPIQIVHKTTSSTPDTEHFDISHLNNQKQKIYLEKFKREDRLRPFNVTTPGLWRVRIFKLSANEYGIFFITHHAIIDGWSDVSFQVELSNIYYGLGHDAKFSVSKLKAGYKDYIIDQFRCKSDLIMKKYWADKLKGYQRTPLPYHKITLPELTLNKRANHIITLDRDLREALWAESRKKDIPAKMFFLSTLCYCIHLTTNSNDVTIGIVTNARPEIEDGDKVLGCFLNTVPFRTLVPSKVKGGDLVSQIHDEFRELKSYDKLSLLDIMKASGEETNVQNPFFDIVINYTDFHIQNETHQSAVAKVPLVSGYGATNTLFDIEIVNQDENSAIGFFYPEGLFDSAEIERFGQYFISVLTEIVKTPYNPVDRCNVLGRSEVDMILNEFSCSAPSLPVSQNFIDLFELQVRQNPERAAVSSNETTLSYDILNKRANTVARFLLGLHEIKHDDLVIIMLDRAITTMECILGIWKTGGAYIPAETNIPESRLLSIIRNSGAKILITHSAIVNGAMERLIAPCITIVYIDKIGDTLQLENTKNPDRSILPNSIAYVIYTSGSTGEPKGVMVEHVGMLNHINAKIHDLKIHANSVVVQNASLSFDISVWQMFAALLKGGRTTIYDKDLVQSPDFFVQKVDADKATILEVVPSYLNLLLDSISSNNVFEKLDYLLVTGEAVQPMLVNRWFNRFPDIKMVNAYGPTEASDDITHFIMESMPSTRTIPIGRPIQNIRIYIVDDAMQLCPVGVKGELCVSGIGVGRGYMNDPEKTASVFTVDPFSDEAGTRLYRTGDIGRFLSDGNIEFYGRTDDQIKIQGNRVELGEIEHALMKFNGITSAAVVVLEDHSKAKYLIAYVTIDNNMQEAKLILQKLRDQLPEYMIPSRLMVLDKLPHTDNGKIDRKALSLKNSTISEEKEMLLPRNELEQKLLDIWIELLNKTSISINENFFELGGDSLKAIRLASKVFQQLNIKIELRNIFRAPSIESLAREIEVFDWVITSPVSSTSKEGSYEEIII
jgi:amino acid adenylation domain-containing protein